MLSRIARQVPALKRAYATVADASGVKVAGIESGTFPAGTTSLTVVVKGGARYETKPGVAHVLKNFAYKTNSHGSALKIARETELYGGVLSSALGREHLYLTAQCLRGDENHFLQVLASVLGSTQYLPHEYSELVLPTVQTEAQSALHNPTALALDTAHAVAFRRGLGNSLYASAHSPISVSDVQAYAQQAFAKSNIAVLGSGISTEKLQQAVQSAFGSGSGSSSLSGGSTTYYGGEQRIPLDPHSGSQPAMVIAYGTTNASADLTVLPHLVGGESSIKWSAGSSPLSQAAAKVAGASARSFLIPYSDASLFGVVVTAPTSAGVASVAKDVVAALKSVNGAKDEDVKKAVAKAKFADALSLEQLDTFVSAASQKVFSGSLPSLTSLDNVSASSIGKAAGELFKGKPTVVSVGDLQALPFADELGL